MSADRTTSDAPTYRGLPPLAGLATLAEASRPGLGVEACVARLKRYHYAFKRLHEILTARITAEPIYELKTGFSHHAYLCAEHVEALRVRVGEMREPPLGLEAVPHPALEVVFDEILAAPTTAELLVGLYEVALPALDAALARHAADTNPLTDAPSVRVCRFARLELADMIAFGRRCLDCLVRPARPRGDGPVGRACSMTGLPPRAASTAPDEPSGKEIARRYSATPYVYDRVPRRDERFVDLYNQGVNPEAFLYDPGFDAKPKALMMLYKRLREIDVPEMMAGIIHETQREALGLLPRHEPTALGRGPARDDGRGRLPRPRGRLDPRRVTHNWSLRLNTECTPIERHAVLYFIEQGLMSKTGKRYEWEVGLGSRASRSMATIQDYDWADEVLHAAIGREWYIPQIGKWKEALDYGDSAGPRS